MEKGRGKGRDEGGRKEGNEEEEGRMERERLEARADWSVRFVKWLSFPYG